MDRASGYGPEWQGFESLSRRMWKEDFYASVRDFINKRYNVDAVEVTDVYDQAYAVENSMGWCDVEYTCEIWYKTALDSGQKIITYSGGFSSLIENIT